ncbi:ribosomal protein S6--L-glutamate ligase/gamma-F420-2:alpha-L-glutamate ligase [Planomicrobium soli]|uniref:Ribosomal protein S6--L-glutamate ligase/gamma-F420-2:alpha-L-glutamate ligase n=1 Tax=Planomicrobium soli TaxID=1176648 RepID=A0A2P8GMG4_9BACL|nr:alpha-L-glutamate ligase [Planomicrobium soli]PSL35158.1 ribosomal protein S6--L-glutamate ligase/gamma-F420-2:alpha-L-glutamate ligase [Planomicrobium soli]
MILLYEAADAKRNIGFIEELQKFAGFELIVWDDWSDSGLVQLAEKLADSLVVFRVRRPKAARFLEDQGIRLVNRAEVNRIANDKWQAHQLFLMLGVPAIPTFREAPEFPCIVKTVDGHGGGEVEMVRSREEMPLFRSEVIFQPVVDHEADVRVYVIGNEIVGAVKRSSVESFKTNFSLGGSAERFSVSGAQADDVLRIARALNSDYVGIDFLLLQDGRHLFNEIEDPVGARSFFETHEENIAELLVRHLVELEKSAPFRKKDI